MSCIIERIRNNATGKVSNVNPFIYITNAPKDLQRDEEIKLISGYDYYGITSHGRVWSFKRNQWLAQYKNEKGYMYVSLSKDGKSRNFRVHRLVAAAFLLNYDYLPQVNHKDEDKTNNHVSNLAWISSKDNVNYGTANARRREKLGTTVVCFETGETWPSKKQFRQKFGFDAYEVIDHPSKTYEGKHYFTAPKEKTVETSAYIFWNKIEHYGRKEEHFAAALESAMKVWGFVEEVE